MPSVSISGAGASGESALVDPPATRLPEGDEAFETAAYVLVGGGAGSSGEAVLSDPPATRLPEGDEAFETPPSLTVGGAATSGHIGIGYVVSGIISSGGSYKPGRVTAVFSGIEAGRTNVSQPYYELRYAPPGVFTNESVPRGDRMVKFQGEDGSVASTPITSTDMTFDVNLGTIRVTVEDVNGEPVTNDTVALAGEQFSTNGEGAVEIGTSGTANVTGLLGSQSKETDVPAGGSVSVSLQYSGLHGQVRTGTGVTVSGATVYLVAAETETVLDQDTTDDTGTFDFNQVPVNTPVTIYSEPFERSMESRGEGEDMLRMLPFETEDVGSVTVEVTDAKTGEPVVNIAALLAEAGFAATTTGDGQVALIGQPESGEEEMTVGIGTEDKRYRSATLSPVIVAGETVEYELELERRPAITRV